MIEHLSDTTLQPTRETLASWALLYLSNELDPTTLQRFESLLETDLVAQEQLALAVQLTSLLEDRSITPDPSYRATVRERVTPSSIKPKLDQSRLLRRFLVGTLAASICLSFGVRMLEPVPTRPMVERPAAEMISILPREIGFPEEVIEVQSSATADNSNMAETWAEITNLDQLSGDEDRKKTRPRESSNAIIPPVLQERISGTD